ncbi:MAG: hypothetical protein JW984_07695 [Deltaproteobacteria bacterium]|uniref:Uncharacterized protein n=1 Tax=Candidatus Zymogenus saltonus TaxID=2844893 RepID=A0A9D8PM48_9DELT|nr:hypothetical protein [Candidatus Zymogenus saltonus]
MEKILKQYVNPKKKTKLSSFSKNESESLYTEGRKVCDVTIVSFGHCNNFKKLTETQRKKIRDSTTILCFSTMVRNLKNRQFFRDDFKLYHQYFTLGVSDISLSSGSNINKISYGYQIEDLLFIRPFYVSSGWDIDFDKKVLRALEKLLEDSKKQELCRRIIRSIEWVLFAHRNFENFKDESRVIMMNSSFEILLNGVVRRKHFINLIKQLTKNTFYGTKEKTTRRRIKLEKGEKDVIEKDYTFR